MAAVITTYACKACSVESSVRVSGLKVPDVPISKKNNVFMVSPDEAKRQIEAGLAKPITVKTKSLEELAQEVLLYATCPRCDARSPDGVATQSKKVLQSRVLGLVLLAVCVAGAWLHPTFGLATPILALFFTALDVYARRVQGVPIDHTRTFIGFAGALGLAAFVRTYPSHAWLVPFVLLGPQLFKPQAGSDLEWTEAKKRVSLAPE